MVSSPFLLFQGLTIIAFNGGFDSKTLRELLSLGPTYVVMKFIQSMYFCLNLAKLLYSDENFNSQNWYTSLCFTLCSCSCLLMLMSSFVAGTLDILMMYGAYSTTRRLAVTRIFFRFIWFSVASIFICFLYVYVFSSNFFFSFFKRFTFHLLAFSDYRKFV